MKSKLFFLVVCGCMFVTCSKFFEKEKSSSVEQVVYASLGAEPAVLDAAKASDRYSFVILDYINEHLTCIKTDESGAMDILPGIAERWEHNEDFTEWTFFLRDAFWSDGTKITANDFVFSIHRIFDKDSASPMAMYYDYIKNAQSVLKGEADYSDVGIIAVDDNQLKIVTENPVKNLDELVAKIPPQNKKFIAECGKAYGSDSEKVICSGAFQIEKWLHNSEIKLIKNKYYWDAENIKLDSIVFKIINEEHAAIGGLLNGSITITSATTASWINKLRAEKQFNEITGIDSRVLYIFMNQNDKLFSNKKIRQALSASLNREEICKELFDDIYKPAYGFVAATTSVDNNNYRKAAGEPIKTLLELVPDSKALFIEGLKELGLDSDTSKITISVMIPSNESSKFNAYLQNSLSKTFGVNVDIDVVEHTVFKKRNRSLDYQIGFKSWAGGIDTPARYLDLFLQGNKIVPIGWQNDTYDDLVNKAKNTQSSEEALRYYKAAEDLLLIDECCIAPFANKTYNIFLNKKLKNVTQFYPGTYNLKYAFIEK